MDSEGSLSNKDSINVAVVGAGPAGIFATEALLKLVPDAHITVIEALPTPYGLVRSGVAPDHFKIKEVQKGFERILTNSSVTFVGNIRVGIDIQINELLDHYHAVILCHGAHHDRNLSIPGENLINSETATSFVGWYNSHPWFTEKSFDLKIKTAAIIGQGNVALDVARILLRNPDELASTDIGSYALDTLRNSTLREVHLIGRRGPLQIACTDKELAEFGELPGVSVSVRSEDLILSNEEEKWLSDAPKGVRRNFEILKSFSESKIKPENRVFYIRFFLSPISLIGNKILTGIKLEKNYLTGPLEARKTESTGDQEILPCDILFRSVGYFGSGIEGIPFDYKMGIYPNIEGRIVNNQDSVSGNSNILRGLYTSGWIKRGPSGVIGTNKSDSVETVKSIVSDIPELLQRNTKDPQLLWSKLERSGMRITTFADWKKIEENEKMDGIRLGKNASKIRTVKEMISLLDGA